MGIAVGMDVPYKPIVESIVKAAVVEATIMKPAVAGITSRRANSTARMRIKHMMSGNTESYGTVCQHLESATARQQITDNNEWCCRHIPNPASDQENTLADIGEGSPAIYNCTTLGEVRRTGSLNNNATSRYRRAANYFRTATHCGSTAHLGSTTHLGGTTHHRSTAHHRTTTHMGIARSARVAKNQAAGTVNKTPAKMGIVAEVGHSRMKTGGSNTADHGEGRQKTYENCNYFDPFHFDPFHWIPHFGGDKGSHYRLPLAP